MSGAISWIDGVFYPNHSSNWDDSMLRDRVAARLAPQSVDLDPRVQQNPLLDEGRVADGERIPYPDASFDLVFADNLLEHLAEPHKVFAEVARVLRPGGYFLFKTPNKWHYVVLLSRLTPHSFHRWVNRRPGRAEEDTFPTLYRANSPGAVRRLAARNGLMVEALELIEGRPEYLRIHPLTYLAGLTYERLVNAVPFLKRLRVVLVGTLRKRQ